MSVTGIPPEEFFSAAFTGSPDMITISRLSDGTFLEVNDAFLTISGYTRDEVVGKTSTELGFWVEASDRERLQVALGANRRARDVPVKLRTKRGSVRLYQMSAAVAAIGGQDCLIATTRDVNDRMELIEGLRKARFLLERAEEMANIGSWEFDFRTGQVSASPGAAQIYGISPEDFSVSATERIPLPEYRTALNRARDELIARGTPYDLEFKIRRGNDGAIRDIHSKASWDAKNKRMFGIIRDVTDERAAEARLREFQHELEGLVAARTQELYASNAQLSAAMERLQRAQKELILSEKLAAIGQLTAGIAHELNTPLGAIVSANGTVTDFLKNGLPDMIAFVVQLTPRQLELYLSVAAAGAARQPTAARSLGSPERKALEQRLASRNLPSDRRTVDLLLDLNLNDVTDALSELFADPMGATILERAWDLSSAVRMSEVVSLAADKAAVAVTALRMDKREQGPEPAGAVNLEAELETALTLLQGRLKAGVTVERVYGGALAWGAAGELGQVWINLLNNALQAMDYKGKLSVITETGSDKVCVHIVDSGPGISARIKDRIFEPFFSTKKPGEGMGLGLDICRKIVERNGGRIEFESSPGSTCFSVTLPALRKA